MTYKIINKKLLASLIAVALVYVGYFFFATVKYQVQPLGVSAEHRKYAFSGNKRVHLSLKKMYAPMCVIFKNRYEFLTEEEFEMMENYARMFGSGENE